MISMLMTRSRQLLTITAAAIAWCAAPHALAQSGQIMVINTDDSGNAPMISHFSMPDLSGLREPDFEKRDLPTFQEKLVLSEAQLTALERQIESYLQSFEQLKKDLLSTSVPELTGFGKLAGLDLKHPAENGKAGAPAAQPAAPEAGPSLALAPTAAIDDAADEPFWGMDGIDLGDDVPGGVQMQIGITVGGDDENGGATVAPGAGQPAVAINFATRNGEELPEDVRKQLEKAAAEVAEQIKQQMQKQLAEAGEAGKHDPGAALLGENRMEDLKKRQDELEAAAKAFRKAKSDLRQKFVADAQANLTADQIERWPALERALLRSKSLPKGRLNGERTDLFKVLKSVNVDSTTQSAIAPELSSYEMSIDAALKQRNDYLEDLGPKVDSAMEQRNWDRALSLLERGSSLRVAVRTINDQFAQAIADKLPADAAAKFRNAVLHASYPQIYRTSLAERTFAAARNLDGLDSAIAGSIASLEQAYRAERDQMDIRIRKAIDRYQPEEPLRPIENLKAMNNGAAPGMMNADDPDPIRDAFTKRRELDDKYVASLKGMLKPEQIEQLPKPPVRKPMATPIIIRKPAAE